MEIKVDNIAGTPVEGENFFGRENVVRHLCDILKNDDILLLGPRRIGKTSTARAVMATVKADGWKAVEINVASCVDETGFLEKLEAILKPELTSLVTKAKESIVESFEALSRRIKSVKIPVGAGSVGVELGQKETEDWTKVANDVLDLIGKIDERWLIYVDELPILLFNIIRSDPQTGVQRVRRFLDWFRNDVRALAGSKKLRWLVSGSVGLDTLVQEHGMADTINSMSHQGLKPFTQEQAINLLQILASSYKIGLDDEQLKLILNAIQWPQPYYLQTAFHHVRTLYSEKGTISTELVEQAMANMVQPGADNDYHHWEQRLNLQLCKTDAHHAFALLSCASVNRDGVKPEILLNLMHERIPGGDAEDIKQIFVRLRNILERDAYWQADESSGVKRYKFLLEPLRLWWVRRDAL
jgi:uncharacterized protein